MSQGTVERIPWASGVRAAVANAVAAAVGAGAVRPLPVTAPRIKAALRGMTETSEVVVVGAGIMGVSTAYHLARLGAGRVIVLERATLCSGSTVRGSGG